MQYAVFAIFSKILLRTFANIDHKNSRSYNYLQNDFDWEGHALEQYTQIFLPEEDQILHPGKSFQFNFDFQPAAYKRHSLFFTGEVDDFYVWKTENNSTAIYKRIDESLVQGTVGQWGLQFTGAEYPKICFRKLNWPPNLGDISINKCTEEWTYGLSASANGIRILEGGYLRLRIEIRNKKDGGFVKHTKRPPDQVYTLDIPEGTYALTKFTDRFVLHGEETANVLFLIEGEKFEGEIVFERPFMVSSDGFNTIPPFAPDSAQYSANFNWFGVNLSKREWPAMRITLNGQIVFDDAFFERCHRYSEKEFILPDDVLKAGSNLLEFTLTSNWNNAAPYLLHEVGIVSEEHHSFDVVFCPEVVTAGKTFGLLLELSHPVSLAVQTEAALVSSPDFHNGGLQVLQLRCDELRNVLPITLSDGITTHTVTVRQVIERAEDQVITGTGDLIYIEQNETDSLQYFKWYLSNHIGNLLTIRPTYRWSGTRVCNDAMWHKLVALMNALGMRYSHMLDGREPNGFCANPTFEQLSMDTGDPSGFLGRQLHERDGAYCYWGDGSGNGDFWNNNKLYNVELFFDIINRFYHQDPERTSRFMFSPEDWFDDGTNFWRCHDPNVPADMELQAKSVMNSMRMIRKNATRHTGPSIMFKYFCMSGYRWIGAETMDSPTEFLLAALRGAAEAYHVPTVGVHHALQWSSNPHEDECRYRRYRLALYVSWMQGAHEHNTEEGLWRMEAGYEAHHRHSIAAKAHLKMQQDFNRYIQTHARQGRLRARVGILHGRYDGYPCFGGRIWGRHAPQGFHSDFDAEQSWHIPRNSFYPHAKSFGATAHPCRNDGPIGLVSPNRRGCFNIIPVEEDWMDYPLLVFFGYNKAEGPDLDRLLKKVGSGATVLLTLGHLTCSTDRTDIESYQLAFEYHPIFKAMGFIGTPVCESGSINGRPLPLGRNLTVNENEVLVRADGGTPLVVEKSYGNGRILFFNTVYYPANPAIKDLYIRYFESCSDEVCAKEAVFPIVGNDVQGVVYDLPDRTQTVYFLAVDWWKDPAPLRKAQLRIRDALYDVTLPFGVMKKALVRGDTAVLCQSEQCDILRFTDTGALVQGDGVQEFLVFRDHKSVCVSVDFTDHPQKEISLII